MPSGVQHTGWHWVASVTRKPAKAPMQSAACPSTAIPPGLPSGLLLHPPPPASLLPGAVPAEQQQEEEEAAKAGKAWDSLRSISWDEVRVPLCCTGRPVTGCGAAAACQLLMSYV